MLDAWIEDPRDARTAAHIGFSHVWPRPCFWRPNDDADFDGIERLCHHRLSPTVIEALSISPRTAVRGTGCIQPAAVPDRRGFTWPGAETGTESLRYPAKCR